MTERILLAHGSGGRLSHELITAEIVQRFGSEALQGLPDAALLPAPVGGFLFSTDSFVVQPLFFPGGCIGDLAVHGTVNDLAACGGKPLWLSLSLIIEEGLELAVLRQILDAVDRAARDCGVSIVTGDTKVVGRGQCDGLFINTAGIAELWPGFDLQAARLAVGDQVIISGPLGDHAMAVMAAREDLAFRQGPRSDTGPVHRLVAALGELAPAVHLMRDPTRGGVAAVLSELVAALPLGVRLVEQQLPFSPATKAAADMLGFDLLQAACEGRLVAICAAEKTNDILACWRNLPEGAGAALIGKLEAGAGRVILETQSGGERLVDWPEGELLPRIC